MLLLLLLHSQLAFCQKRRSYEYEYDDDDDYYESNYGESNLSQVKQPSILGPENLLLLDEKVSRFSYAAVVSNKCADFVGQSHAGQYGTASA